MIGCEGIYADERVQIKFTKTESKREIRIKIGVSMERPDVVDNVEFAHETITRGIPLPGEKIYLWCSVIDTGKWCKVRHLTTLLTLNRERTVGRTTSSTIPPILTGFCAKDAYQVWWQWTRSFYISVSLRAARCEGTLNLCDNNI